MATHTESDAAMAGQVALITGCGSGIGRATARVLARRGVRIGALGRTASQLEEALREIEAEGSEGVALRADVSDARTVAAAVDALIDRYGRINTVFANAGINGMWTPVDEMTEEEWDQVVDINLKGTFLTAKYTVPHLKATRGSLAICSSVQGTRMFSVTGSSAYAATKAAQVAYAKKLAVELGPSGVRVNVVCPGWIRTEIGDNTYQRNLEAINVRPDRSAYPHGQIPLTAGEPGDPEQVGAVVAFLASPAASHVTGTEVWVDGAESLLEG